MAIVRFIGTVGIIWFIGTVVIVHCDNCLLWQLPTVAIVQEPGISVPGPDLTVRTSALGPGLPT